MSEMDFKNLQNKKEKLREICEIPRLFLANYFLDLRRDVDIEIVRKKQPYNRELKQLWIEIIMKIDSLEKECMHNINLNKQEIREILNQIDCLIQNNQPNVEKIHEFIQNKHTNILKQLFCNKTIIFKHKENFKNFRENLIDAILIIINDDFINFEELKERGQNEETILDDSVIKMIQLDNEIEKNSNKFILDIKLHFKNLKELDLNSNKIKEIQRGAFKGLNNLEKLWLANNKIRLIRDNTFLDLNNLKELHLFHNKIEQLFPNEFQSLKCLKTLDLSWNLIKTIHQEAFQGLIKLEALFLSNNEIKVIYEKTFVRLENLKELDLTKNDVIFKHSDWFVLLCNKGVEIKINKNTF